MKGKCTLLHPQMHILGQHQLQQYNSTLWIGTECVVRRVKVGEMLNVACYADICEQTVLRFKIRGGVRLSGYCTPIPVSLLFVSLRYPAIKVHDGTV